MSNPNNTCQICGEGNLRSETYKNSVEYKGRTTELDVHYSLCDECGSEQADAVQTRKNKRLMTAFKKNVDGLLSGGEVRLIREKLGLSQADAAKVFGGGPVAFSKYENDDVCQSESMDKLLRVTDELPAVLGTLNRRAGLNSTLAHAQWQDVKISMVRSPGVKQQSARIVSTSTPPLSTQRKYAA